MVRCATVKCNKILLLFYLNLQKIFKENIANSIHFRNSDIYKKYSRKLIRDF